MTHPDPRRPDISNFLRFQHPIFVRWIHVSVELEHERADRFSDYTLCLRLSLPIHRRPRDRISV